MKLLLCCGGGFSSSYLVDRMNKQLITKGLNHTIDYSPFALLDEVIDNYDIVLLCPHLKMEVSFYLKKHSPKIPLYLLPPKMYGRMDIEYIVEDAIDIINIFNNNKSNPVSFPGEDNLLRIKRYKSYRQSRGYRK